MTLLLGLVSVIFCVCVRCIALLAVGAIFDGWICLAVPPCSPAMSGLLHISISPGVSGIDSTTRAYSAKLPSGSLYH